MISWFVQIVEHIVECCLLLGNFEGFYQPPTVCHSLNWLGGGVNPNTVVRQVMERRQPCNIILGVSYLYWKKPGFPVPVQVLQ